VTLALFNAVRSQAKYRVWNYVHTALLLQKGGSAYVAQEMEIWQSFLAQLPQASAEEFEGFPLYALPFGRHADLQAALWNYRAPGTFPDCVSLIPYLQHWALHRLGEIAFMLGALDQALSLLQQSARLFSQDSETWLRIAEFSHPSTTLYVSALENCFDIDPMNPEIGVQLLEARFRSGNVLGANALCWELDGLLPLQCKVYGYMAERYSEFEMRINVIRNVLINKQ
jgi:tetratricopeptide (TPR) repeat protein